MQLRTFVRPLTFPLVVGIGSLLILYGTVPAQNNLRIVAGLLYVYFLPGYVWTWLVWPSSDQPTLNRLILAALLSAIGMPMIVLLANRIGLPVSAINTLLLTSAAIILGLAGIWLTSRKKRT